MTNTSLHYTKTAKSLHWLMALLLTGMIALGLTMQDLPLSPQKLQLYAWHKWAGVSLFLLVIIRLAWRLMHPPPPLPWHMSTLQRMTAQASHVALYGLMLAIPLSGWLMSSAKGFQTVWFGVLPLPDLLAKDKALGNLLQSVHWGLNVTLITTVTLHLAASLKHHFFDQDDILMRMLPTRRKSPVNGK